MVYDAQKLIEDCASSAQGRAKGVDKHEYGKVWNELQHWISGQMDSSKGANIPSFGEFLWVKEGANKDVLKPEFKMADTFSRNHHISRRPVTREALRSEALPFGKIAGGLPRDKAVVCTKHLLSRLGEVIEQGKDVQLNFGVGTLKSRGRQVDFSFDGQYANGRPRTGQAGGPPPRVPMLPSMEKPGALAAAGGGLVSGASRGSTASSAPSGSGRAPPAAAAPSARGAAGGTASSGRRSRAPPQVLPGSKDLKAPHMYQIYDAATQLAFERHQFQKKQEDDFDRATEANARQRKARLDHQARLIRDGRKAEAKQLALFLEQQMKEKRALAAQEKAAAKIRPPSRLPTPQDVAIMERKQQQERQRVYRQELIEQMSHKKDRKKAERFEEYLDYQDAQAAVEEDIMCEHMARIQHKEVVRTVLNNEWSQQVAEKRERLAAVKQEGRVPVKGLLHEAETVADQPRGGRRRRPLR